MPKGHHHRHHHHGVYRTAAAKSAKMHTVMSHFKHHKLHIGNSHKLVHSRKQAVAIGMHMAGLSHRRKR
jgi:hypothetical protein